MQSWFAEVKRNYLGDFLHDPVDGFISQVFSLSTTPTRESLDQPVTNFFILTASFVSIAIEPRHANRS
jgi:hypothetical protein